MTRVVLALITFGLVADWFLSKKPITIFKQCIVIVAFMSCLFTIITVPAYYTSTEGTCNGSFSGVLGLISIPIYDVEFSDDVPMKELKERYIILEKSEEFQNSFKIILKDEIDNYTIEKTSSSNIKSLYEDLFK